MKKASLVTILAIVLATSAAMAAEPINSVEETNSTVNHASYESRYTITPFNLAYRAYRGLLENYGIPGYILFCQKYNSNQLTAEDVIQATIEEGRLTERDVDESYINNLDWFMWDLCRN